MSPNSLLIIDNALFKTVEHLTGIYPSNYGKLKHESFYSLKLRPSIRKGLEKAVKKKAPFELIILDISMPDISGIQVLNQIRTREKNLKTPKDGRAKIIMVTASMRRSVIRKCIRLGCNSYIAKPYNRAQIFRELERLGFTIPEGLKKKTDNKKTYTSLVGGIIKRFNSGEIELPVLPRMVQEVQNLLKSSDPSIEELADIITKDAVISTRLIAIANSSLYKGVDAAKNLNAALLRLGLEETLNVITTLTNKNLYKSENVSLKKLLEAEVQFQPN